MIHFLHKPIIKQAYILLVQAERSIDHTLDIDAFDDLVGYYKSEHLQFLEQNILEFKNILNGHVTDIEKFRKAVENHAGILGSIWRRSIGVLLSILPCYIFTTNEISWIYNCLNRVLDTVTSNRPVAREVRVGLRMDIATAEYLIFYRCIFGINYRRANRVVNAGQPDNIQHYSVAELFDLKHSI